MGTTKDFKEQFKKRCFDFSLSVLPLSTKVPLNIRNRILLNQLLRAATSIGANVVEGGMSISKREFISYFQIALKSSSETLYWLQLLEKINPDSKEIHSLINECIQIKKLLSTIVMNSKLNN